MVVLEISACVLVDVFVLYVYVNKLSISEQTSTWCLPNVQLRFE